MDVSMGLACKEFVLLCTDMAATSQIITMKDDEDKIFALDSHKLVSTNGEPGDRVRFAEYIEANCKLYRLRNGIPLSTKAVANFTRSELAKALRKGPKATNLIIAGYDEGVGASMYYLDYLGTLHRMNATGYGYGAWFVLSMFDKLWRPDLTQEEALEVMMKGINEIKKRLVVAPPTFCIKIVDKDGIRTMATI
eukprot:jgi/Pico_ML_1/53130/g3735.t1